MRVEIEHHIVTYILAQNTFLWNLNIGQKDIEKLIFLLNKDRLLRTSYHFLQKSCLDFSHFDAVPDAPPIFVSQIPWAYIPHAA